MCFRAWGLAGAASTYVARHLAYSAHVLGEQDRAGASASCCRGCFTPCMATANDNHITMFDGLWHGAGSSAPAWRAEDSALALQGETST